MFVHWIGPDSTIYNSSSDIDLSLSDVSVENNGNYELFIKFNNAVGAFETVLIGNYEIEIRNVGIPNTGIDRYVCHETTLELSAEGGDTYRWTGPNSLVDSIRTISIDSFSYQDTGWYKVEINNTICSSIVTDSVRVKVGMLATASSSFVLGSSLCYGDTLKLFSNGGSAYSWSGPDGVSSTDQNPVLDFVTTGDVYSVVISDNDLCIYDYIDPIGLRYDTISLDIDIKTTSYNDPIIQDSFFVCPSIEPVIVGQASVLNNSYLFMD
jgi:hypothetical protein